MIECTQILLKDLEIGSWYIGRGRGGGIGYWDGECFATLCIYQKSWAEFQAIKSKKPITESMKNGREVIKHESYFYKDEETYYKSNSKEKELPFTGLGSFQPFLKIDFGEIVGKKYDGAYGEKLNFE